MPIHQNDRVLVTGAASGLGLALVEQPHARGCRVLATDVHEEVPGALTRLPKVTYRRLDVRSDADWQAAYDWVAEHWNGLDLLVTSPQAGDAPAASAAGLAHPPRMSEYNSVRGGVVALSETLTHELKPLGVAVSVVCPTFFKTNLSSSLRGNDPSSRASAEKLIDGSAVTAAQIADRVVRGIKARRPIILTDRNGRVAYAAKRFARPLYDRAMGRAAKQMASQDT